MTVREPSPRLPWSGIALLVLVLVLAMALAGSWESPAVAGSCGGTIRSGQAVTGQIARAGSSCSYSYTGKQGETIAVRMSRLSRTLDPYLSIVYRNQVMIDDDDNGGSPNSAIAPYDLSRTSLYTIEAGSSRDRSSGTFILALSKCTALPSAGRSTSGYLSSGQIVCYTFTGRKGSAIDVHMDETKGDSKFDPYLDLYNPYGLRVSYDDNSGSGSNANLSYRLPSSGTYAIIARSQGDQGTGSFTLKRDS